jgi:hypothetical protein
MRQGGTLSDLAKTLLAMVLDIKVRNFLFINDPDLLQQAIRALRSDEGGLTGDMLDQLLAIEAELRCSSVPPTHRKADQLGHMVLVLSVEAGCFVLRSGGKVLGHCRLEPEALAHLLTQQGFDLTNKNHVLMQDSSVDSAEERGAPKGFHAVGVMHAALKLSGKI